MSLKLKPAARSVALAFGGVIATVAMSDAALAQQTVPSPPPQTLERVTITGSNIRRTDAETVAPVQIITREDITRSGKQTVAEVLKNVSAVSGGSYGESFSNSFAPGAAGISLRGLGEKTTLVLINGRRTASYGFAQNLQDTFVDINSIPTSAVERIEILKDGASAIYGSDAIAGVINIILRKDFKGIETGANYDYTKGGNDYRANITAGFGDLGSQKFNVFGVLDYYKRDELLMSDTKFGENRDFRDYDGGRNFQGLNTGGAFVGVNSAGNIPSTGRVYRAIASCANPINYATAVARGLIQDTSGNRNTYNTPGNTFCPADINTDLSALPGTERIGFLGKGVLELSPSLSAYTEIGLSRVDTNQTFTPPFFEGSQQYIRNPTTGTYSTPPYNINFAPGVAGNPLSTNARFTGSDYELGDRTNEIRSDTYRVLAGLKYTALGWDGDSGVSYSKNKVTAQNDNRISLSGAASVFNVPTTIQPPTPLSTSTLYNLNVPGSNSPALINQLRLNFPRVSTSDLFTADTKVSTEFNSITLPGGPLGFAAGVEYRKEKINDMPDVNALNGNILGQGTTATDGSRNETAAYGEFSVPFTSMLEGQIAGRVDHYSDFGTAATPKLGLKFKPAPELLFRANWGRGFRAPTLPEISKSSATFFTSISSDPYTNTGGQNISGSFAGNPQLKAEKSLSETLGAVWEPSKNFSASVDYYYINWSNIVGADNFSTIVANDSAIRPPLLINPTCAGGDPRVVRDPTNNCAVLSVNTAYRNFSRTKTSGFDVDARYALSTVFGRFTSFVQATYVSKYEEEGNEEQGTNGGTNTIPRLKGTVGVDWDQGPYTLSPRLNYISAYTQALLAGTYFSPCGSSASASTAPQGCAAGTYNTAAFQNGTYPEQIPAYYTFDLNGQYRLTPKFTITAGIDNLFNRTPPYDPGFSSTYLYDFSLYDVRGRIYRVGVNYKFM